jgi:DNA-binding phage protein
MSIKIVNYYVKRRIAIPRQHIFGTFLVSPDSLGEDMRQLGLTAYKLLEKWYGRLKPVKLPFRFIARAQAINDYDKAKGWDPAKDDPLIFADDASVDRVLNQVLEVHQQLVDRARAEGLPIRKHKFAPKIDVVDEDAIIDAFGSESKLGALIADKYPVVCDVMANHEVIRKFVIQRVKYPGWWINSNVPPSSKPDAAAIRSLQVLLKVFKALDKKLTHSDRIDLIRTLPDYPDTNGGYPNFDPSFDPANPLINGKTRAALELKDVWKDVLQNKKTEALTASDFDKMMNNTKMRIARVYGNAVAEAFMGVGTNSRFGPMDKSVPLWEPEAALKIRGAVYGLPRIREVWMASFMANVLQSSLIPRTKGWRLVAKGLWFDDAKRDEILQYIKDHKLQTFESDASAFDKSQSPYFRKALHEAIASTTKSPAFARAVLDQPITMPLIIPDPADVGYRWQRDGNALLTSSAVGLLSGIRLTSDLDTWFMVWLIIHAYLSSGVYTEEQIIRAIVDGPPLFLVFGDDTLLLEKDLTRLARLKTAMRAAADTFGLKLTLIPSDRFLMRRLFAGTDAPVTTRILQQTLANEYPVTDPSIFNLGLAARLNGLKGIYTDGRGQREQPRGYVSFLDDIVLDVLQQVVIKNRARYPELDLSVRLLAAFRQGNGRQAIELTKLAQQRVASEPRTAAQYIADLMKQSASPHAARILQHYIENAPALAEIAEKQISINEGIHRTLRHLLGMPSDFYL